MRVLLGRGVEHDAIRAQDVRDPSTSTVGPHQDRPNVPAFVTIPKPRPRNPHFLPDPPPVRAFPWS
jgi:hypothetical protein